MKWFRRILWTVVFLILLFVLVSYLSSRYLGKDIETLDVEHGNLYFSAQRDIESGAWKIKAPDEQSLWFAFGYVQTWDREFQTELVRLAARGDLSRMLGDAALENDRLMRFSYRASEDEFLKSSSIVQEAAEMFIEGRSLAQLNPDLKLPIEYQFLALSREDLPDWTPEDVVAIARFHSWQLSFDSNLEQIFRIVEQKIGADAARLLFPSEPTQSQALYSQEALYFGSSQKDVLKKSTQGLSLPKPNPFFPKKTTASIETPKTQFVESILGVRTLDFDWGTQLGLRGASNMWILADPRVNRELTLCNDTHLRFSWPSSLYPVQYELEGVNKGTGFMLPAVPALVIGAIEGLGESSNERLSWGITLASYGDTQDLIFVPKSELANSVHRKESYGVRNLENSQVEVRRFDEFWTPYGPRVDSIFNKIELPTDHFLVLDWVGYSTAPSPFEFFLRRNLEGQKNIVQDLHSKFSYPAFNFTWIEQNKNEKPRIGHLVTGWLRSRPDRKNSGLKILNSNEIKAQRKQLEPSDRPYFYRVYDSKDPFFLVTANQRVWEEESLSLNLVHSWEPDDRAKRIVEKFKENVSEPSFSQSDDFSPTLFEFYKTERNRNSVDRLCSQDFLKSQKCIEMLSELDAWQGSNSVQSWQTTVVALWHAYFKLEIFKSLVEASDLEEMKEFISDWHRRAFSAQAVNIILRDETNLKKWEDLSSRRIREVSLQSFQSAINTLVSNRGDNRSKWRWGQFHKMDWLHPIVNAPEPWGKIYHDSVLGPRPGVPGAIDSPGRFEYTWSEDDPLNFAATHGASLRICTEFSPNKTKISWSAPTGPSGNPFSKHSKAWSFRTFFRSLLSEVP